MSRTNATTSAATSRQRTAGIARVAHHAQAKEKMAQPRPQARRCATGARTAIVERLAWAPALLDPSGCHAAGSLLRRSVHTCVERQGAAAACSLTW